ncbi:ribonuclease H-like protein [Lentinus brumalis]|uniref:Ribonuclease H n=1 Tax=Lentinus brumalis TaxID=2498619 RepID=A0A371CN05_9APHY|nr:ribonuclease H-like protein [Polyporus brumalis]
MAKVGCYAVARGRKPGIYLEWKDCSAQVLNFNGAKYKKFLDAAEAELWINANASGPLAGRQSTTTAVRTEATTAPAEGRVTADEAKSIARQSEAVAVTYAHASNRSSAPRMETAASVPAQRAVPPPPQEIRTTVSSFASGTSGSASSGPIVVYTDGSCRGNGKPGSTAGVGVWWGVDDPRNVSERCPGDQTNNRAELLSIIRVLERAPTDRPLEIRSDSQYSISCMTAWVFDWKRRGWRKSDGKPVLNLALIQYADLLLEERRRVLKQSVEFKKVLAHSGVEGNEAADRLANEGAALPAVPELDWDSMIRAVRARMDAACSTAENTVSVPRAATSPAKQAASPSSPQPPAFVSRPTRRQPSPPVKSSTTASALLSPKSPSASGPSGATVPSSRIILRTTDELASSDVVHGRPDLRIAERELEIYAECLLDDDELMREAELEGVYA